MIKGLKKEYRRYLNCRYLRNMESVSTCFISNKSKKEKLSLFFFDKKQSFFFSRKFFNKKFDNKKYFKSIFFFPKIKYNFAGKAYRVKFFNEAIWLKFHRSHPTYFFYSERSLSFTFRKNKWVFFKTKYSLKEFINFKFSLNSVRWKNIYTNRGFWSSKNLLLKKKGKISGYR